MPGLVAPIRALHGPGFSAPRLRPGGPPNLLWLDHNEVSSHRFDLAIATWWRTFFDLWKVQADRYAYFVQSIESRFYPLEERVVRAAVHATYDAPLGIITEASPGFATISIVFTGVTPVSPSTSASRRLTRPGSTRSKYGLPRSNATSSHEASSNASLICSESSCATLPESALLGTLAGNGNGGAT